MGAYDEVSEAGKVIRSQLIPFYSWLEVNFKRYKQLGKNIFTAGTAGQKAGFTAKTAANVGAKAAKTLAGTFFVTGVLSAWNMLKHPELEETLPEDVKARPHIILGKDKDGNTVYFSRLGALNDFLEWFGLDTAGQDIKDLLNGKKTIKEQLLDMVKSPVNKLASGVTPLYKTPAELATGQQLYPDVFSPKPIRDKGQYASQSIGLRKEYDLAADKPQRPYLDSWKDLFVYKADPEESAYWDFANIKSQFNKKKYGEGGSFTKNDRSMALYNYKLALRYKDQAAAKKYLEQYKKLGGTSDGLKQSLQSMDPLYGVKVKDRKEFINSLTEADKKKLELARKYYKEVLGNRN
jgi:hypothetical protein